MAKKQVVVIGAGQGGLSAAIHARLAGHDVLVLEKNAVGGKAAGIVQSGYELDPGPSIIILPEIYRSVFRKAGKNPDDYLKFVPLNPITRVFYKGDVVDIPAGFEACYKLLQGYAPEDAESFADLYRKLEKVAPLIDQTVFDHPYDKPWQLIDPKLIQVALPFDVRLTYKEIVDNTFKSGLLRAFFYGFPSYGGQSYRSKAAGALLIPFYMLNGGVFYPEGGVSQIPKSFHRLALELGVEFRENTRVASVVKEGKRILHVETDLGERISGDHFIFNRDRVQSETWMGRPQPPKASYSYFTAHWGVRAELPEIEHHSLIIPDDFEDGFEELYEKRDFPKEPIIYLNNTTKSSDQVSPPGCTNLFAVVTSPSREDHFDWKETTEKNVDSLVLALQKIGVDLDRKTVDFERIQTPLYFEERHENFRGSLYGADEKHRLFGLFPWRNYDEQVQNVGYCGGSVQPGAGLPMVTLSGRFAAEAIK